MISSIDYQEKKMSLISIIDDIINVEELNSSIKSQFISTKRKLQEDEFSITLIGEFQGGKSTTFDSLCGGREISPRGNNIKTSSCRISMTNISEDIEEYAIVFWKSNYELALTIYDVLTFLSAEDFGFAEDKYHEFNVCEVVDFSNEDHLNLINKAIRMGWKALNDGWDKDKKDILIIAEFIVNFYNSVKESFLQEQYTIDEASSLMTFPVNMMKRFSENGINAFSESESLFTFVKSIKCYVHSEALAKLGCTFNDCPGLFASRYDTAIALQTINESDATLYLLGGEKQIGQSDKRAIAKIAKINASGATSDEDKASKLTNIFFAINQRKSDEETSFVDLNLAEINSLGVGYNIDNLPTYNALLYYLATFGKSFIGNNLDQSTINTFLTRNARYGLEVPTIWVKMVKRALSAIDIDYENYGLSSIELNEPTISLLFKLSKAEELFAKIETYVINQKAESILLTNGAERIETCLSNLESKLKLRETTALQDTATKAAEFQNAREKYDQFKSEVEVLLDQSFKPNVTYPIIEDVYDNYIRSSEFLDSISLSITKDLIEYMKQGSTTWKGIKNLWGKAFSDKIKAKVDADIKADVEPFFKEAFKSQLTPILQKWVSDLGSGSNRQYRIHFIPELNRISDEIKRLWSNKVVESPLLKSIKITTAPIEPNNLKVSKVNYRDHIKINMVEDIASNSLGETFNILLQAVIGAIIGFIVIVVLDSIFTLGIACIVGAIIEILYIVGALSPKEINTKEDLNKKERKLFEAIKNSISDALSNKDNKEKICYNDTAISLIAIPNSIANGYRSYYREQLDIQAQELKAEIDEANNDYTKTLDELRAISRNAENLRNNTITPLKNKTLLFIESVKNLIYENN